LIGPVPSWGPKGKPCRWRKEFPTVRIAETGSVFDYFLDEHREFGRGPTAIIVPSTGGHPGATQRKRHHCRFTN